MLLLLLLKIVGAHMVTENDEDERTAALLGMVGLQALSAAPCSTLHSALVPAPECAHREPG